MSDPVMRQSNATAEISLSIVASLFETKPSHGRKCSMPHAHARLRSAVPLRRAMIDRAELLALLAARLRRVRGLSGCKRAKQQSGYSKNSERHGTLPGCCKNPFKLLDRCGVSRWVRRHRAGVPRRDVVSIPRTDGTAAVNAASALRHCRVKGNLSADEALSGR